MSLLGHLNFASRVVRPGRTFVSYLIKLSTTVTELHQHVRITAEVRLDLDMWKKFLEGWNGVSMFLDDTITSSPISIYIQTQLIPTLVVSMVNDGSKTTSHQILHAKMKKCPWPC